MQSIPIQKAQQSKGVSSDSFAQAQALVMSQRYPEALALMRVLAARGDREAQRTLGEMLFHGEPSVGSPALRDRAEAGRWFRLASAQGCPVSRYYLDWYYDRSGQDEVLLVAGQTG